MKTLIWKYVCTPMFIAALCSTVRLCTQPKCPSADEETRCDMYIWNINERFFSDTKEWNFYLCSNMDGSGGYYS